MNCHLPLIIQPYITQYAQYSLKVNIILTDNALWEWFLQRFTNIYGFYWNDTKQYGAFYAENIHDFGKEVLETHTFSIDDFMDEVSLIQKMESAIQNQFFVYIMLNDEIMRMNSLKSVHPYLLCGYDNEKKTFDVVGYNTHLRFERQEKPYQTIAKAFFSEYLFQDFNGFENKKFVQTIKNRRYHSKYRFSIHQFISDLANFIDSSDISLEIYQNNPWLTTFYTGLSFNAFYANQLLIKYDDQVLNHLIPEHRQNLLLRLKHASEFFLDDHLSMLVEQYGNIIKRYIIIERSLLKKQCSHTEASQSELERWAMEIRKIGKQEKDYLVNICDCLYFLYNRQTFNYGYWSDSIEIMSNDNNHCIILSYKNDFYLDYIRVSPLFYGSDIQIQAQSNSATFAILESKDGNFINDMGNYYMMDKKIKINMIIIKYRSNREYFLDSFFISPHNLLCDAYLSASSFYKIPGSVSNNEFSPANILINSESSAWVVDQGRSCGEYIHCQFNKMTTFSELFIKQAPECNCISRFLVQYRNNNTERWRTIAEFTGNYGCTLYNFILPATTAKEFRFYIDAVNKDSLPGLTYLHLL